ncbi:MAG TPA: L,D-transpeptidase [Candidatus Binatia bacterium]|nr:L,D-transpeptidase [Candidatus Binatia bacterium]
MTSGNKGQPARTPRLPTLAALAALRNGIRPSHFLLTVSVATQTMSLFERRRLQPAGTRFPRYAFRRAWVVSTSRFGVGQAMHSKQTPLGLHRVAQKVGAGHPIGTIFKSRRPVGLTWKGQPDGEIVHRILWLEGLEAGFNRGGTVDSLQRYIYIHGFGDETTLGRPTSQGCIHLAGADLMPLFERLPVGTLVWIAELPGPGG